MSIYVLARRIAEGPWRARARYDEFVYAINHADAVTRFKAWEAQVVDETALATKERERYDVEIGERLSATK